MNSNSNESLVPGLVAGASAALVLGLASTFGDWIWASYLTDGAILPGLIHGVVFFVLLAVVLAVPCSDRAYGARLLLLVLPALGLLLAAVFYPLAYAIGYIGSLMVTWVGMWLGLAATFRMAREPVAEQRESATRAAWRGVAAAVGSGLAFWAVSDMWTRPTPGGPDLVDHALRWTLAFFPGMAALFWGLGRSR